MKLFATILVIGLYVIPTIGLTFSIHYCGGEIASVSLGNKSKGCTCGTKPMKKGCCTDETFTIKSDVEQQKTDEFTAPTLFSVVMVIPDQFTFHLREFFLSKEKVVGYFDHPPPIVKEKLFLLNRSIII